MNSSDFDIKDWMKQHPDFVKTMTVGSAVYPRFNASTYLAANAYKPDLELKSELLARMKHVRNWFRNPLLLLGGSVAVEGCSRLRKRALGIASGHGGRHLSPWVELAINAGVAVPFALVVNPAMVVHHEAQAGQSGPLKALKVVTRGSVLPNLFRGTVPTGISLAVLSSGSTSLYERVHAYILEQTGVKPLANVGASLGSAFVINAMGSPFIVAASLRNRDVDRRLFASAYQALKQSVQAQGLRVLWVGSGPRVSAITFVLGVGNYVHKAITEANH